jgi:hypothetical protein
VGIREEDILDAIEAHGAWKARFRDFLVGKTGLDLGILADPDACKLGHWLENEGRHLLNAIEHEEITQLHADFHRVTDEIVKSIKPKEFTAARKALAPGGDFARASKTLTVRLRKAATSPAPRLGET